MALTFVKRSSIPASVKGKVAASPSVGIGGNGQLTLNTLASKFFNGDLSFGLAADGESGTVTLYSKAAKAIAKAKPEDLCEFKVGKKTKTLFWSATNFLKLDSIWGANKYDYAKSGNQTFEATIDEKAGTLSFVLPKGAMAPRPVVHRVKKPKAVATAAPANQVPATSAELPIQEDELILESA